VDIDKLLSANVKKKSGTKCMVGSALAKLDSATKAKLVAAIADHDRFTAQGIASVFTSLSGLEMSRSPVERHRRGDCQCPK
jgi:hypothetical protein